MLHEFLTSNRERIIARTRSKVAARQAPRPTEAELENGVPLFLTQLVAMLQTHPDSGVQEIGKSAAKHGDDLLRRGFTVEQVVHDYGGLCQAITEIASEDDSAISTSEFKVLNGCLDDAIASAVSEFGRQREASVSDEGVQNLGFLAHELRNALNSATLAFEIIKRGTVGTNGSTGAILAGSLKRMKEIIDRSLAEVRLKAGPQRRTTVSVAALIEELVVGAAIEAQERELRFTVGPTQVGVTIDADPHLLVSSLTNLLQNAFKFTQPHGHIALRTVVSSDRVRFEIEDECGGLPNGNGDDLFRKYSQRGADRTGLGLGLAISRQAVEETGGTIAVRDLPGRGCIFSVDLPRKK